MDKCWPCAQKCFAFGMKEPYKINRKGTKGVTIKPYFSIPTLVHLEITYACMANCIMCYNPARTLPTDRDKDNVWDIIKSMAKQRVPHVYLIGGEPTYGFSTQELSKYVDYLYENGSSVSLITNGQIRLKGMTKNLACFGISIHGSTSESHDFITGLPGSWARALETAKQYIAEGFDLRFITVVMGRNAQEMYDIARLAHEIGAESVYFDIYEPGGIGEKNSNVKELRMQPTQEELKIAIGQIIQANKDFSLRGGIGLGTALPYCFDERLIEAGMAANCGVGTHFGAVTNVGDYRICNQSKMVFGNVLETSLHDIWMSDEITDYFRSLDWVEEPCSSCPALEECAGGCKVDEGSNSGEFRIDRIVRGLSDEAKSKISKDILKRKGINSDYPAIYRKLKLDRFFALTDIYKEYGDIFFKTRYQTVRISEDEESILKAIENIGGIFNEKDLINAYKDDVDEKDMRVFISELILAGALNEIE